jgi:putative peptide zinc metalloprotease protein
MGVGAQGVMILAAALPVLGMGLIFARMSTRGVRTVWRKTRGRPVRRGISAIAGVALVAALAVVWWPNGSSYRPIQPYERGTVADAFAVGAPRADRLVKGQQGQIAAIWPEGVAKPTADKPRLAMVLVPRPGQTNPQVSKAPQGPVPPPAWVFPFSKPLPPSDGGNQALAVNTQNGSVVYDIAFALVWVEDGSALNTNEAYAFASCQDCAAVAVAFQVVLIVGQANVVVPQNLAVAANYNCAQCLAVALANQLVLTLDGPLSPAGMDELAKIWAEIGTFEASIGDVPLSQLQDRLNQYIAQIQQIIEQDPSATHPASSTPSPSTTTTGTSAGGDATAGPGTGTTGSGTATEQPAPASTPSEAPSAAAPYETASAPSTAAPSPAPVDTAAPAASTSPS